MVNDRVNLKHVLQFYVPNAKTGKLIREESMVRVGVNYKKSYREKSSGKLYRRFD